MSVTIAFLFLLLEGHLVQMKQKLFLTGKSLTILDTAWLMFTDTNPLVTGHPRGVHMWALDPWNTPLPPLVEDLGL